MRLDHVGIAVARLDDALAFWTGQLGATLKGIEEVASQKVRVAFLVTGASKTELLEPISEDSPIAKFLASGRSGVHHLAYRVDDIDARLRTLARDGVRLIHERAVPGSRGTKVAFIHPKSADGVLLELVEYPESESDSRGPH
ncbi:MAG: methylmalonyl-CoA epimerase [Planctomycetes bacterium]|nr:methylmalonyl-CoA epimerase [Planctomycetota bacterium]